MSKRQWSKAASFAPWVSPLVLRLSCVWAKALKHYVFQHVWGLPVTCATAVALLEVLVNMSRVDGLATRFDTTTCESVVWHDLRRASREQLFDK